MRVVVLGTGRTGVRLAALLVEAGHHVSMIDWNESAFSRLPADFPGQTVLGNGVNRDVLRMAGIEGADAFVASTSGDNRNIMASQIVQHVFRVPKVICRIKDPSRAEIYQALGIEVDCRTTEGAKMILDMVDDEV